MSEHFGAPHSHTPHALLGRLEDLAAGRTIKLVKNLLLLVLLVVPGLGSQRGLELCHRRLHPRRRLVRQRSLPSLSARQKDHEKKGTTCATGP